MKSCSSQPGLSLKRTGYQPSNHLILPPTIMIWKASYKKRGLKKRVASPEVCDLLSGIPHPTSLFTWWVSLKPWYSLCVPHCSPAWNYDTVSVYPTVCRLGESVWKLWYSLCVPHCSPDWNSDTVCVPHCLPAWNYDTDSVYPPVRQFGKSVWKLRQSLCVPHCSPAWNYGTVCVPHCSPDETMIQSVYPTVCRLGESVWKLWYSLCVPHCSPAWNSDTVCVPHCLPAWWVRLETLIQSLCTPLFAGLKLWSICWLGESVWKLQQSPGVPL